MKRAMIAMLILLLLLPVIPAAYAAESPAVTSNINDHWYINAQRWTDPINSTLRAEGDGYLRVENTGSAIVIEEYDKDFQFVSGTELALELPIYGGVYLCDDYNFVLVGQTNPNEDDTQEVFRIIRYSKDWERQASASLYGANTVEPFRAGCPRFDRCGGMLYVRTSHSMYADENGTNHQANVMIAVRISDMTITDEYSDVMNPNLGYVSHSFNQFVRVDGTTLLTVDHGDAYTRSVVLMKYPYSAAGETFFGRVTYVDALPIAGTIGANDTGVSVGGFEFSSSHYLIAGNSAEQLDTTALRYAHRNVFVTATPKDTFTNEDTVINWITSYTEDDAVSISPPHLLKLDTDRFFLIWTENNVLTYCFLNGQGEREGENYTAAGNLSDCVPIFDDNRILWYVTNSSEPVFYLIDLNDPGKVVNPHVHVYSAVTTAPTCTQQGYTTYTCSVCGDSYVDDYTDVLQHSWQDAACTVPKTCSRCALTEGEALGHDYGEWVVESEATCTESGSAYQLCSRCGAKSISVTGALGHKMVIQILEPTCTQQGYQTSYCERCDYHGEYEYTDALGHSFGDWYQVKAPTCTEKGQEERICGRCSGKEQRESASLSHDYCSEVTDPTCTEAGFTTHTCSRCGDSYTNTPVEALDHAWDDGEVTVEPTENTAGEKLYTCQRCGETYAETIPELGHEHSYDAVVTAPDCTEQGCTTYTCRCGDSYVEDYVEALGHSFGAWETTREAACTEAGEQRRDCSRCDHFETRTVDALGHNYGDGTCTRCGEADPDYIDPSLIHVTRLSGKNRYQTAFAVANQLKENLGIAKFASVIVAYGQKFPDALAGSYLAAVKNAPILLTEPSADASVLEYIEANLMPGGRVYILGGTAAVSQNFEDIANAMGFDAERLKGANRYETNLAILREAGVDPDDEILIATGENYADSLSASATGLPLLLVGYFLTAEQRAFLYTTSRKFVIIGGTGAVSEGVQAELEYLGISVTRVKGSNRYSTSVAIAERYFKDPEAAVLAYAQGFPDGLCGGPLAISMGAPLILTSNESPAAADAYVENILVGAVTGGTGRISDDTVREIFDLAADMEISTK